LKGNVLIIDDEVEIRRNLTIGLTQEGYSAVACPDGISAIHELEQALAKGLKYDYLVTDIFMPDVDGLKILKVIRRQYPHLPVLVITGYGDVSLEMEAVSEYNTGYLDKPFEIADLVKALEELAPGTTESREKIVKVEPEMRVSVSAYLTLRVTDPDHSMDIYMKLYHMDGVQRCEAVRGDVDIIVLAQADSKEKIEQLFQQIRSMDGVDVVSMDRVARPKLDRDVHEFIKTYSAIVKEATTETAAKHSGTTSYVIVDINKDAIQQVFTTVFFIDEVVFCDVIEGGSKLVGMITGESAVGAKPRIIEKLNQIEGVLRVREAKVIKIMEE
jgi:CheY-like chemotaxis protein/nitrate reductase NapAB chaperone NapD